MIVKISNNGSEHEDKAKAHLEIVPTDASLVEKRFDSASALVKGSLFHFPRRSISAPEFRTLSADALRAAGDAGAKERGVAANPEVCPRYPMLGPWLRPKVQTMPRGWTRPET
jgi:hypothetical protein